MDIRITELPNAPEPISGSEAVPVVQNGQTVQTTVAALVQSPTLTQTFLTVQNEPTLPNSRFLATGAGLASTDAGAQAQVTIAADGVLLSLVNMATGMVVKTGPYVVEPRAIAVTGAGLAITNGDALAGDPTVALDGMALSLAQQHGTGFFVAQGSLADLVLIQGSTNQVAVTNGDGSGNVTIALADNTVFGGTQSVTLPTGTTTQRGTGVVAQLRYNSTTGRFEGYDSTGWVQFGRGDGTVTSVSGTANQISVANGTTTPIVSIANNPVIPGVASMTVPKGSTAQRSTGTQGDLRYNTDTLAFEGYTGSGWNTISIGGVTLVNTGNGLTGGPITSAGTIAIDTNVVVTLSNTQTLLNKTISGASNTITNIANSSLVNSAITIGSNSVALGGTLTAFNGVTINGSNNTLTNIGNSSLSNSSVTYNGVSVSLGGSGTITAASPYALTIGTGLSGTSYNGSSAVTIAIDSTVATLSGVQTLTNKTIDGGNNTLQNIPNSALSNSSITLGTTNVALGGTSLTLAGLTSVTVTQDPTQALELATKQYVDSVAQGLNVKAAAAWGTTANITLSGLGTQAGGEWTGTLTAGDRILVKNQAAPADNGIYAAAAGPWTRTADANAWGELVSAFVFVQQGATLGDTGWVCTVDPGGTLGVTPVTWVQFSGQGTYTAGTGLTLTGTTFSITNTGVAANTYGSASAVPVFAVNAQGQITSVTNTNIAIDAGAVTSGILAIARGGTNSNATPTLGAVAYGDGSSYQFSAVGTAGQVLTSTGAGAPAWSTGSTSVGTPGYYGAFQDTTNQIAANTTTAYAVAIGITDEANGVSITSGNRITLAHAGTYNVQYSIQFTNTDSQDGDVNIWLRKNGSDLTDSNSRFTVPSKHGAVNGALVAVVNYVTTLAAGDYLQLYWSTNNTAVSITTIAAQSGPPVVPLTPGVILTVIGNPYIGLGYGNMTSSTSLTVGTGTKSLTVNTNSADSAFTVGTRVRIVDSGDVTQFMEGPITAYSGTSMTVSVENYGGSGTYATWNITVAGVQGSNGVTYFSGGTTGLTPNSPTVGSITLGGTLVAANGGTGYASYAAGDMLYASGATALSKLAIGSNTYIMASTGSAPNWVAPSTVTVGTATNIAGGAAGSVPYNSGAGTTTFLSLGTSGYVMTAGATAPQWSAQSTLSVGVAAKVTIAADTTNADYFIDLVSANTGDLAVKVASGLTANPSTGKITGGVSGGTF